MLLQKHLMQKFSIPPSATKQFSVSQKNLHDLRSPDVHYCTHKCPPSVSILTYVISTHVFQSLLLKTHYNIIFLPTARTSKRSLSLMTPYQSPSTLSRTCYMPRPSHSSWFDHPHNIGWAVLIILLCLCILIVMFMYFYCYVYVFLVLCLCILIVMCVYFYCYACIFLLLCICILIVIFMYFYCYVCVFLLLCLCIIIVMFRYFCRHVYIFLL
jgi:hypothetical protein